MSFETVWRSLIRYMVQLRAALAAAVAFYTCLPIPPSWTLEFRGIARLAPVMGLMIGGLLGLADMGLQLLGCPVLTRSALVVVGWIGITGGLHLDGAMDTADGLAAGDPQRRLEVMADSLTGAFGAIAAVAILLLKTAALADLDRTRWLILMGVAAWGRWGQLVAIARYPYLKAQGKGAFHKDLTYSPLDLLPGVLLLSGLSGLQIWLEPGRWLVAVGLLLGGSAIAILTGTWLNYRLGGHTGDTYGAVVEWTEALLLCLLVALEGE
ncbi:adenosylcobinamide-GDP ribazoletransferase [Limnospira fusiformis KN01]|nr:MULTISPECIES: adenosylcobinamide-GDP ribazoletransferase [Limnospira]MDC0836638.1 adenosylcobinamide-GDP ribazoletransferase [Limnoraphis robusta]MDT9233445.1 adenosylcobinamide-GDP ribazoletransferase [Limnospira sp. PMC 917.15]MDT9274016.1 adenosylcobinamide-GDP ribazoletransferase [Limnospira sp. PMC 737.11]ULB44965.1 adenosylcobinamide-GDP ribazoletransferase [Limnospira fusiformis KN01]